MMHIRFLETHRDWEDWLSMLLGVLIGFSPWVPGEMGDQSMMINAVVVGSLVFYLGELEATNLHRWQEGGEVALGSWLGASPFIFGYSATGTLRIWHFILGAVVVIFAVLKMWQDRNRTTEELAEHGQ